MSVSVPAGGLHDSLRIPTAESPRLVLQRIRRLPASERFSLEREAWLPLLKTVQEHHPSLRGECAETLAFVPSVVNDEEGFAFLREFPLPKVLVCMCIEILDQRWPELWRELNDRYPEWAKLVRRQAFEKETDRAKTVAELIEEADKASDEAVRGTLRLSPG